MTDSILNEFAPYNEKVREEIALCLNRSGNLSPLLEIFGAFCPTELSEQVVSLKAVLGNYGQVFFLAAVKGGADRAGVRKMAKHISEDDGASGSGTRPAQGEPRHSTGSGTFRAASPSPVAHGGSTPGQSADPVSQPPSGVSMPRSPYAAPANRYSLTMIDVPGYKGPERRKKKERRQPQEERRSAVDMVYKNRRFGGNDRRKFERRSEEHDTPKENP